MLYGVHGAACFLEMECHSPPRHVMPNQIAAQSLFAKRRRSPDDVVWWRSATGQVPVASAMSAAQNSTDPINSGTWPHQLEHKKHE